jgi:hypothetical protein
MGIVSPFGYEKSTPLFRQLGLMKTTVSPTIIRMKRTRYKASTRCHRFLG